MHFYIHATYLVSGKKSQTMKLFSRFECSKHCYTEKPQSSFNQFPLLVLSLARDSPLLQPGRQSNCIDFTQLQVKVIYAAITLERKRHRLEWIHSFPSYVFILSGRKDQRNFRFRFRSNITPPLASVFPSW